jgi:hypothetical protein
MIGPAISASGATQILVATKPVDVRKQADSLAALVQEALGADPYSGAPLCVPGEAHQPGEATAPVSAFCQSGWKAAGFVGRASRMA